MNQNYAYFLEYVRGLPHARKLKILDYGCGNGALVAALRREGFDAVGCDVFYEGGSQHGGKPGAEFETLLANGHIRAINEVGDLPWAPGSFDVILANQVFEHVEDFPQTISRLERVLAADGHAVLHFPSREVWREGHIGIPLAHRLSRYPRFRLLYTRTLRRLGFGYHGEGLSADQWARRQLDWIDRYCFYRPYSDIKNMLEPAWSIQHNEWQYVRFRARTKNFLLRWLVNNAALRAISERLFRRLGFMSLILRKR